ncbi:MAG: ankyrin repeat domain-containing protein [Gammaproteobacteria bacterium]|nr:ankyrin repeat domain-containing protein [Gammaproteobacteria bacterium]
MNQGAETNNLDNAGNTLLAHAAANGSREAVKLLLTYHADIDQPAGDGNTALMLAASQNHIKTVAALLESGAEITIRNKKREQARDIAEAAGHPRIMLLLDQDRSRADWLPDWL